MINILFYTEIIGVGGIENMMLQWIKHADEDVHIDIFVNKVADESNRRRFVEYGCKVYEANCSVRNLFKKARVLSKVLKIKKYDVVHVHTSSSTDFFVLAVAKKRKIGCRIAHSHNVPVYRHLITKLANWLCKPLLRHFTTGFYGCSKQAAIALFGNNKRCLKKYVVIKNGIDALKYSFSMRDRENVRKQYAISDSDFVIGSIGRLDFQKNYSYLLKICSELKDKRIKIMIVGDGEERENLQEFALQHNLNLILTGRRDDISKLLCCFDLFCLTSRYEGFPVVMMEAQSNGLKCLVSEAIPEEAILSVESKRVSLSDETEWIGILRQWINHYSFTLSCRENGYRTIVQHGYDISECSNELMERYKNDRNEFREGIK